MAGVSIQEREATRQGAPYRDVSPDGHWGVFVLPVTLHGSPRPFLSHLLPPFPGLMAVLCTEKSQRCSCPSP